MAKFRLFGEPGWGSVIVEAQLEWYGLEFEFERVGDLFESAEAREKLEKINPLAQVPTLLLPDGTVMTESAAITLLLADMTGENSLVPAPGDASRAAFLRWLVFIVANVYPTYTYGDDPARFVPVDSAQKPFEDTVLAYARKLYEQLEDVASAPWFLGERFSAIDIYICAMTRWQPKRQWFAEHAPKLHAIAEAAQEQEKLRPVWARNLLTN
ncbi:MAG: glutathione S-transferase [Woeseiaceae bacterium]|nr:glutathione S-transferase [Woeseiaceae bacterium]